MKHRVPLTTMGVALAVVLLSSCGTSAPAAGDAAAPEPVTSAEAPSTPASGPAAAPQVTTGGDSITIAGSGNGETAPVALDQPYYIVRTTNAAAADYGSVLVTVNGEELPAIMTMAAEYTSVFQPSAPSLAFTIEATGAYTIEFSKPPAAATALDAPQTFTGAAGTTLTPVVRTRGTYVKLGLKYTGAADPGAPTGAMLATATIYDAVSGDQVLNVPKYVNKAKTEDSDGNTRQQPGSYFLIVTGSSDADTWEASITED